MTKANAHYVDCDINPDSNSWTCVPANGYTPQYPTLQELATADIPTKPDAPTVTAADTSVSDATELQAMSGSTKYYLTKDIDLTGVSWTPIEDFAGVLDGKDFTISNLTLNAPTSDNQGLFRNLNANAEIYDLTLDNFNITCDDNAGCLAAYVDDQQSVIIKSVDVTNSSITGGNYLGSMIGWFHGDGDANKINSCSVTDTDVTGDSYIGGFIGSVYQTSGTDEITDCHVSGGTITGNGEVGGFFGDILHGGTTCGVCHTCYTTAAIVTTLAGGNSSPSSIGGFAGDCSCDITSCYCTGTITHSSDVRGITSLGGFAGAWYEGPSAQEQATDCYSTSEISIAVDGYDIALIGGFIGFIDCEDTKFLRCYSTGDITIDNDYLDNCNGIGGFIGYLYCSAAGDLSNSWIKRCFAWTDIYFGHLPATGGDASGGIGGFIGTSESRSTDSVTIENCYTWCSITADDSRAGVSNQVGGFISAIASTQTADTTCLNCYDAQTEDEYGSGLTGQLYDGGTSDVGGFLGDDANGTYDVTCTECFWDTTTSSITDDYSDGAVGHITAWMQTKANYTTASWDFDDIWYMPDIIEYPVQKRAIWYQEDYSHIEGETVQVLGDGEFLGTDTVSSGAITLDDNTTVNHVGIGYTSKVQPMKVDGEVYYKSIKDFYLQMYETLNGKYGETLSTLYSIPYGDTDLFTGHKELPFEGSYNRSGDMWVTQSDPLPMVILGIVIKAFYSDGSS